ncbi:hypothetical protein NEOLEDRAFT_43466 [Neolentinus lepideus HHB14362 ss-1]|uniref:Nucleoporin Pom152 n=1 Tax=Neolentinus lepideus HHB14362 ss-1 TaxID=1314782 RepID=A0A165W9X8_9AGAM|nr:hypothetical protein NEOLEDRAFT_43466 [Neolentinus lepideus HHB14362 ss-1]
MPSSAKPLIPEKYLDIPTQRLYFLSLGLLCQAIKLFDVLQYNFSSEDTAVSYCRKWLIADTTYLVLLSQLRIPRLDYSKAVVALQILGAFFIDGLLFGGINIDLGISFLPSISLLNRQQVAATPVAFTFSDLISILTLGVVSFGSQYDSHLLGQHTVRMSPISTARLNPDGQMFCLNGPGHTALVPVLLNNTSPIHLQYSLTPLGVAFDSPGRVLYNLTMRDLNGIERKLQDEYAARAAIPKQGGYDSDEYDEYDDDDNEGDTLSSTSRSVLQKTQSVVHIAIDKPGVLRLHRVLDSSKVDARILYASEVVIAPCPRVEFADAHPAKMGVRCAGADQSIEFAISMYGVAPLSLRWHRDVNGKREHFMVEGIQGGHDDHQTQRHKGTTGAPQSVRVPLTASLDSLGTHVYVLESVVDGVGNVVHTGSAQLAVVPARGGRSGGTNSDSRSTIVTAVNNKITRTVQVLSRPAVSFMQCGPGRPASLLIGQNVPLTVSVRETDAHDSPWQIEMRYEPSTDNGAVKGSKRSKAWTRTISTLEQKTDLSFRAEAPGTYSIVSVRGTYCEGDILAPESCKVVELPRPTAEVEWKRIHECSGDTGVSASMIFHGTPPFTVYYRMQRDNEPPHDLTHQFTSSRGELTLQPDLSGHYVFSFVQISDANYKRTELRAPSIEQVIHPLASAAFVRNSGANEETERKAVMNTCEGESVDVDVNLRGTGPWNLEVQIVSPRGTETLKINDITESRRTLRLPIPRAIDKEGGTFEIDLASVEDKYKCKRTLTVPGVSVNVRRVKPVARFYGKDGKRNVTVLEKELANLPLRLTGDGPWHIKYRRREEPDSIVTVTLRNPNDQLSVSNRGLYELLEVHDSQCPGTVPPEEATYQVNWVPRPSARLASETEAMYEPYNNSYILPSVCEGVQDHVDLDLIGRPPFQIVYNVARDMESGALKLLEQPTFSSIQHRTRFQLRTHNAGRMYYEVKQIGDAAYPLTKHKNFVIPRGERLLFEQEVMTRPSAQFRTASRMIYCLYDAFIPHDSYSSDGLVVLEGTPPFLVTLSIKNLAASETHTETVELKERTWKIDLPSYSFKSIGPHLIKIESVWDASHCEQAFVEPSLQATWVDVAESAAIIPFDRREYFCVGETSRFSLEGTPPWTIGYRVNGKSYTQETKVSPFSLLQQQTGEFSVTSVAHQNKMCKTAVTDLRYTVHPVPSAQVGRGKRIFQDIHEGDQAEIIFTLLGEPPFTFTYQRAEPSPKKGGKPGKVLETHTVTGVTTKEYTIFSALEGTWTVTFISDRYCRYPPAQVDKAIEK